MSDPLAFLLGAGFNFDAAHEVGGSRHPYPLVADLISECFQLRSLPAGASIEQLFQAAADRRDREPMNRLADALMFADYDIVPKLQAKSNVYQDFLDFAGVGPYLTFNYDALLELLLFRRRLWRPEEGFGVPLQVVRGHYPLAEEPPATSEAKVLHLHGSLYVYPSEYRIRQDQPERLAMIELKETPDYIFDPDSIAALFIPYDRRLPTAGFAYPGHRVVAPVPEKAAHLTGSFIRAGYDAAVHKLAGASQVVAIGYSFNPQDAGSFEPITRALTGKTLTVVAPDASATVRRMAAHSPQLEWRAVDCGFAAWVRAGCRLT